MVNSEGWRQRPWHAAKTEEWSWGPREAETVGKSKAEIAEVDAALENMSWSWIPCEDWEGRPPTGRRAPEGFPDCTCCSSL